MKKVVVYTWRYCPFCVKAKGLLDRENIQYDEIVIDGDEEARMKLKKQTGSGSVPQIFVDDVFIGGCDELHALYEDINSFDKCFGR